MALSEEDIVRIVPCGWCALDVTGGHNWHQCATELRRRLDERRIATCRRHGVYAAICIDCAAANIIGDARVSFDAALRIARDQERDLVEVAKLIDAECHGWEGDSECTVPKDLLKRLRVVLGSR